MGELMKDQAKKVKSLSDRVKSLEATIGGKLAKGLNAKSQTKLPTQGQKKNRSKSKPKLKDSFEHKLSQAGKQVKEKPRDDFAERMELINAM